MFVPFIWIGHFHPCEDYSSGVARIDLLGIVGWFLSLSVWSSIDISFPLEFILARASWFFFYMSKCTQMLSNFCQVDLRDWGFILGKTKRLSKHSVEFEDIGRGRKRYECKGCSVWAGIVIASSDPPNKQSNSYGKLTSGLWEIFQKYVIKCQFCCK